MSPQTRKRRSNNYELSVFLSLSLSILQTPPPPRYIRSKNPRTGNERGFIQQWPPPLTTPPSPANQPTNQPLTRSLTLTQINIPHQRSGCRPSIHPYVLTSTLLTNSHDHCTVLYFTSRYLLLSRPPIASRRPEWHFFFLERDPRMAHFSLSYVSAT